MNSTSLETRSPFAVFILFVLLVPLSMLLGLAGGYSEVMGVAAAAGVTVVLFFAFSRFSPIIKLFFILAVVVYLQLALGFFTLGEVDEGSRGLSIGNLLILAIVGYWFLTGVRDRRLYRPTPIDVLLILTVVVVPLCSYFYTISFRDIPGYEAKTVFLYYKRWVTPFVYFFVILQCVKKKEEARALISVLLVFTVVTVLGSLPEVLLFSGWREARTGGAFDRPNTFAALLAESAPFYFLTLFLVRGRPFLKALLLLALGCLAVSMLTTYSRSGYIGLALGLGGAVVASYRAGRRVPIFGPAAFLGGVALVTVLVAPQVIDQVVDRFTLESYDQATRKSKTDYLLVNQFTGDRLELWSGAFTLWSESPVFGIGYRAFIYRVGELHRKGTYNAPHSQYFGALAEGGIVWLGLLLLFYWKLLRLLWDGWKRALRREVRDQIICGGGLLGFLVMLWMGCTLDVLHPSSNGTIFWVTMACALKYGLLLKKEDEEEEEQRSSQGGGEGRAAPALTAGR